MADITEVVDWSAAPVTEAAKNIDPVKRQRVIVVPRKTLPKVEQLPYVDVEARAARGEMGMSLLVISGVDRASGNVAWVREGRYTVSLRDRCCLYSQGWSKGD